MTADEQANLVLAFAKVLYVNGQATEQTVSAAERLAHARGLHATIMPRWGELQLVANERHGTLIAQAAAYPAGVEMNRVASTMRAIEDVVSGRLGPDVAVKRSTTSSGRRLRRHGFSCSQRPQEQLH